MRNQEQEITSQRISEYKHTTCTLQPEGGPEDDYPEPTNKSSNLIEALLSEFEQAKATHEGDDNPGADWWSGECARLESNLRTLMDIIYRMRGLHVVTRIVDEDKINDDSGENQWELCFTCSCCEWFKNCFCVDVQMFAHGKSAQGTLNHIFCTSRRYTN